MMLLMLKALYDTQQATAVFWKELLKCMKDIKFNGNGAEPFMYFRWTSVGLKIWMPWADDCMIWGPKSIVPK